MHQLCRWRSCGRNLTGGHQEQQQERGALGSGHILWQAIEPRSSHLIEFDQQFYCWSNSLVEMAGIEPASERFEHETLRA